MRASPLLGTAMLISGALGAADTINTSPNHWGFGGEIRFQLNNPKNIPIDNGRNNGTTITESLYSQIRSQLWGKYTFSENMEVKARVSNEFRHYDTSKPNKFNSWKAPGEWVFDEVYVDIKKPLNTNITLRVGRQSLFYGTGKIIAEGTPADGSRTTYSNAIKARIMPSKSHTVDLFYFNNPTTDSLAINSNNQNLVEWDESGFGVHGAYSSKKDTFFNYYYIFKNENRSVTDGKNISLNTMGIHFTPYISPTIRSNIELAKQWGKQGKNNKQGILFDSQIDWLLSKTTSHKPTVSFGYYYLSGDDESTSTNEAWSPVLSRWPQYSSLYLLSFIDGKKGRNAGSWSNLKMPWLGVEIQPFDNTHLTLRYFHLSANTIDAKPPSGLGSERGKLITAKLKYKHTPSWSNALLLEVLKPGNYYKDGLTNSSYFRFESALQF